MAIDKKLSKDLEEEILDFIKDEFGGKAWFDGGTFQYLIDAKNPKKLVASDGAEIRVEDDIIQTLEKHVDRYVLRDLTDINAFIAGLQDSSAITTPGGIYHMNRRTMDEATKGQPTKIEAYGYKYNNRDQRIVWRKVFPTHEALNAWAEKQNATVIGTRSIGPSDPGFNNPKYMKEEHEPIESRTGDTADKLSIGTRVAIIGKSNRFYGLTGTIDSFDSNKAFVVVDVDAYGKRSFHSSDVAELLDGMYDDMHLSPDGQEVDEFYVTFYSERGKEPVYWIGKVAMHDTKWREYSYRGEPEYRWGQTYMSYLTPDQVVDWIKKDYAQRYEVGGPFYTQEELNNEVEQYYGAKLTESKDVKVRFGLMVNLLESKKKLTEPIHPLVSKFDLRATGESVHITCAGRSVMSVSQHDWKDLVDAVKNRTTGNFGGYTLAQAADSYRITDSSGDEVAYLSATEMDHLIAKSMELLKEGVEYRDFDEWKRAVLAAHRPEADRIKFKGRVEGDRMLISAEIPGKDRSYGVWNQDDESGVVLEDVSVLEKWDDSGASDANGRWAKYRDGGIGAGAMATWLYNSRVHKKTKEEKLKSAYGAIAQQENTSKLIGSAKADALRAALKRKYGG